MEPNLAVENNQENEENTAWKTVREWVQVIVIALVISLPIRFFIAEPFVVQGASMDPTFSTGQFLIIDRLSYRFESPSRGDVIVFEYPNDPKTFYIKRIIGLPGETVDIKDGKVTVVAKRLGITLLISHAPAKQVRASPAAPRHVAPSP